jgi:hypothetical protein
MSNRVDQLVPDGPGRYQSWYKGVAVELNRLGNSLWAASCGGKDFYADTRKRALFAAQFQIREDLRNASVSNANP